MESLPKRFIVFDTEFTSWEGAMERGWSGEGEYKELVQIGAVKVEDLTETDSFLQYVKPVFNPKLSEYFTELTRITQEEVDANGVSFDEAQKAFSQWAEDLPMYSMQGRDGDILELNASYYGVPYQFKEADFRSAGAVFDAAGIDSSQYISSTILTAFGAKPLPGAHDALSDARSILKAIQAAIRM